MPRRLLLASVEAGGGHFALRDSFAAALASTDPHQDRFTRIIWNSSDRSIQRFYSWTMNYLPRLQGTVYAMSDNRVGMGLATRFSTALFAEGRRMLQQWRPEVLISTHPILSMVMVKAKRSLGLPIRILSAIPDYGIPSASFNPPQKALRPDGLIVMSEETRAHYEQTEGLKESQLHLSGFITRPDFVQLGAQLRKQPDRRSGRVHLLRELEIANPQLRGLDPSRATLLFMGGSAWTSKTRPLLEALLALPEFTSRINVVVVCGRDEKFRDEVSGMARPWKNFAVFGFVPADTLAKLMAIADFPVLGSLAPATMQELLELGCGPLMLFDYIPGTELPHTSYIRDQRIGKYEPDTSKMLALIMSLTGFAAPTDETHELLRAFPDRASALRSQSLGRALELGDFLEGFAAPHGQPAASPASRTTSAEGIPALRA